MYTNPQDGFNEIILNYNDRHIDINNIMFRINTNTLNLYREENDLYSANFRKR